jgi:quercetin dioxygenase-like cupin family protein
MGSPGKTGTSFAALAAAGECAPGQRLPWHVHPGGHEFGYVLEGAMTSEVEGHGTTVVKAGALHHVLPGVAHFGRNAGTTRARTLVFRIKDKAQPISAPVSR